MSGHNRWQQIRHKKTDIDQKRGQIFSKLSKLISIAARKGTNPESNIELKNAIERARFLNMPSENIERAVKKVSDKEVSQLEMLHIELVGPKGSAFVIRVISDNKNRTISELKSIFKKHGFKMVQPGALAWMFKKDNGDFIPKNPVKTGDEDLKLKVKNLLEQIDDHNDVEEIYTNLIL